MKKLTSIFFIAILFVSAGCKKSFFDINQNPNSATEESVTPNLILPRVLTRVVAKTSTSYSNIAGWMGYWGRSGTYGPNPATEGYNLTASFEADEWDGWYDILFDVDIMEKKATESGQNYYVAVAKILKSIGFMYIVDQYNNAPYSEAFDLVNHINPSYDKGPAIYADLIAQLNTAMELLNAEGVGNDNTIEAADVVFHNDPAQWQKLANTQKLKLLIHESEVITDAEAEAELASTAEYGYLSVLTASFKSHAVSPYGASDEGAYVQIGYTGDTDKQNPFWDTYQSAPGTTTGINQYWRANNFIFMLSMANDDRYAAQFDPPYVAVNYGEIVPNTGVQASGQADVSGPGLAVSATQAQWLFTVTESLFLQAEAAQRGWIGGSAQDLYEAAVKSSYLWLGVAGADAQSDAYLAGSFGGWNGTYTTNKIKLINTQKYIAMCGVNNFEGWVDYRRLDGAEAIFTDPDEQAQLLSFSPERGEKDIPLRLIYAQSEYSYNAANVGAEGTINPQSSRIFWDAGAR